MDGQTDGAERHREREVLIPSTCNGYWFHVIYYHHYLLLQTNYKCLHAFLFENHHSVELWSHGLSMSRTTFKRRVQYAKKRQWTKEPTGNNQTLGAPFHKFWWGFYIINWTEVAEWRLLPCSVCCLSSKCQVETGQPMKSCVE